MQAISDRLKTLGGESIETATVDALGKLGRAMVMSKLGNDMLAQVSYREADAAFEKAIETHGEHPMTRQVQFLARSYAIGNLRKIANQTGNAELKKEADRQRFEVVREREKLTELEPLRIEWWRNLSWG